MKIEIFKQDATEQDEGNFMLFYGKSKVGKTATSIQTAEDPIFWIIAERGQVELTMKAIKRPDIKLKYAYYDGWDDLLETIYTPENFKGIKTVIIDSLTHVMNIHLRDEILEENYEAMSGRDNIEKSLTVRVKLSQEGYGTLSRQMTRLMKGLENLTKIGIDVILTARDEDNPKWNRQLACGPNLSGKEFGKDFKGFFDFIGLIQTNINKEGKVEYPPLASFDDDGSYLSGWSGIKPETGVIGIPFNVKKILDVAHGRAKVGKKGGDK